MDDNYDFFTGEPEGYGGRRGTRVPNRPRRGRHNRAAVGPAAVPPGSGRLARADTPVSRALATAAAIVGVLAIVAAGALAVRATAPAFVPLLQPIGKRVLAIVAVLLMALALVLIIAARHVLPPRVSHHGVASGGIMAMLVAVLLLAFGLVVGVLFRDGLIRPHVRDEAPVGDTESMEWSMARVTGECANGWQDIDVSGYPGVDAASVCPDTRVAFVTFDNETAAELGKPLVKTKITGLLEGYADDERAQGDWRLLTGGKWMAFGDKTSMEALEYEWGGMLESVE